MKLSFKSENFKRGTFRKSPLTTRINMQTITELQEEQIKFQGKIDEIRNILKMGRKEMRAANETLLFTKRKKKERALVLQEELEKGRIAEAKKKAERDAKAKADAEEKTKERKNS